MRTPCAITPSSILISKALIAVSHQPYWWDISENDALKIMMRETGGQLNPKMALDAFAKMVREVGLVPIEAHDAANNLEHG